MPHYTMIPKHLGFSNISGIIDSNPGRITPNAPKRQTPSIQLLPAPTTYIRYPPKVSLLR